MVKIAPSILSADFRHLAAQVQEAERAGADWIHVDVMDGRFVPNITMGPFIVETIRSCTTLPLDVHLMIGEPERYIRDFASAGASIITVHQEVCPHLQGTLAAIRQLGVRAGVALCPGTTLSTVEEVLGDLDLLLMMTVNPGFSGQVLVPHTIEKVRRARSMLDQAASRAELEVDGGIGPGNVGSLVEAGAEVIVAASAIFNDRASIAENMAALRGACQGRNL